MALDESVFADYAAARGDFGSVPGVQAPVAPQPMQVPQAPAQAPAPQMSQLGPRIQPQPERDTLGEFMQHPIAQFANQWKNASPEKRKQAEDRIFADLGNPENMIGIDVLKTAEERANEALEQIKAKKEGMPVKKSEKVKNKWGKFMQFVDSNPQFLLELGAKLLAPRASNVSSMSHIASGLSSSMAALNARKAATQKAALEGQKTQAETGKLRGETSKIPSEIQLNVSKAYKNYQDAKSSNKPAAKVEYLDALTDAFYATGKETLYKTREEAKIAASRAQLGHGSPEEQAVYDMLTASTESISITGKEAMKQVSDVSGKMSPTGQIDSIVEARIIANNLYAQLKKSRPNAPDALLQQVVKEQTGQVPKASAGGAAPATAPTTPKKAGGLEAALAARKTVTTESPTKKLGKWKRMASARRGSRMNAEIAKEIRAEVAKEFDGYSQAEQKKAVDLIEMLDSKFK